MKLIANVFVSRDRDCVDLALTSSFNSFLLFRIIRRTQIDSKNIIVYDIIYESNLMFNEVTVLYRPFIVFIFHKTYV